MQTQFSDEQRKNLSIKNAEAVIRRCVHCGFCLSTCPTYLLLGDELDSPRGRIYLIKNMLENEQTPSSNVVRHIDRCLSCLACVTTCPSDVNYMQLIDHARVHIEKTYKRPFRDRLLRRLLTMVLPHRKRFSVAVQLGWLFKPLFGYLPSTRFTRPVIDALRLLPQRPANIEAKEEHFAKPRGQVILLRGCAESVLQPNIRLATIRLLCRSGFRVVEVPDEACCGSLMHHLGQEQAAISSAKKMVNLWHEAIEEHDVSAILTTVSGCGTTLKNYGQMLKEYPDFSGKAIEVSALVQDIGEFLIGAGVPTAKEFDKPIIAYHAPCSLLHAQKAATPPPKLLRSAGFEVRQINEEHICCGSAGVYNILQPELATALKSRKIENIEATGADVIATSNIGCITQLASGLDTPVVHVAELLDWATGGPMPPAVHNFSSTSG